MLVSFTRRVRHRPAGVLALALGLALLVVPAFGRGPEPSARIELARLGYQDFPAPVLASGASLLTLHYVDDHHLLLTFNKRRLMPRIPEDPPDDNDRNVDAVLLELPSGRVLARTSWRMHDIGQYLWSLGHGHFLLRLRDRLVTVSPLVNLKSGNAFQEHALIASSRAIGAIFLSPDARLLTLETVDATPPAKRPPSPRTRAFAAAAAADDPVETPPKPADPVQINFFRLIEHEVTGLPLAQSAGTVRAPSLSLIPADASGYLAVLDQGRHHFAFDFHEHSGKVEELAPFDSTCFPAPLLVSRSEFIALGCRNGNQMQMIGGFNLHGEEMWEQVLSPYVNPSLALAPAAGRVAFSRVVTSSAAPSDQGFPSHNLGVYPTGGGPVSEQIESQTVNVIQMESGRQIFSLTCTPILRAGGNFTLSDDGSEFAIVRGGAVEIYPLPPLSDKEKKIVERAASYAPEPNSARIRLNAHAVEAAESAVTEPVGGELPAPGAPAANAAASALGAAGGVAGAPAEAMRPAAKPAVDPQPVEEAPRKAPTLYAPDEKPAPKDSPPGQPPKGN